MKKSFLLIYFSTLVTFAFSQEVIKEIDGETTRFIPGAFMKNGVAAIYFSDDEYGYDGADENKAEIFDFELNPLKTFTFKTLQPYTVIESRAATGTETKTKDAGRIVGTLSEFADTTDMETRKNQFANYLYNREVAMYYPTPRSLEDILASATIDGTTVYVTMTTADDYHYSQYSDYITSAKAFLASDNTYGYLYRYTITVTKYDGEWTTTTNLGDVKNVFYTPRCVDVSNMNHWNGGVYLPFSQTFFNDDEKFEYVCYKSEVSIGSDEVYVVSGWGGFSISDVFGITGSDRDGDGEEDYRYTVYGVHRKGFEVISEDGSVLYSFDFPDSYSNSPEIQFFKSDNYILAQLSFEGRNDNGDYTNITRFYRIDKSSAAAPTLIREENRVSAVPNPASKGTPVVVSLSSDSSKARKVSVTSLSGGQVFSQSVAPGVSQVSIPTTNLSSGMYLFTVTEAGRKLETCKIIIK
jgi:hypothetical protein